MARFFQVKNPLDPWRSTPWGTSESPTTIRQWLKAQNPTFVEFPHPTLCCVNGREVMRADWDTLEVGEKDIVHFITLPAFPALTAIQWLYVLYAVMLIAVVVMAATMRAPDAALNSSDSQEGDPVYKLKGQRNQVKLGDLIEDTYGRVRKWPSYAAVPYNKYQNNEQWLYQLFCLGQGEYEIGSILIENTPISSYVDVEYEIIPPNGTMTLFPDNVVTAAGVQNIELFAANEALGDSVWVEDSPGDPAHGIDPTGHWGHTTATAFTANPAGTLTTLLEVDVSLPRGLYLGNAQGGLDPLTITALFEARKIDDAGAPLGGWFTIASFSQTLATATPQRYTIECPVPSGRYEVRGSRTSDKNTTTRAANTLLWEALRAFLPSDRTYGNVTLMAMKARASNNLNDNSSQRVNLWLTRKLPIWNGSSWSAPTATRSIAWAFAHKFRAPYAGRVEDQYIDLAALLALDALYTSRSEYFDWTFDSEMTVWDAATVIALVGRAVPMLVGTRVTMIRDEAKTVPVAIFNQENIKQGSFRWEIRLPGPDGYDGLDVEYTDPDTWKTETVEVLVGDDAGTHKETLAPSGITDRTHAYNWGRWKRAVTRYQRENLVFTTGREGNIPTYGALIGTVHDTIESDQGGLVLGISGGNTILQLSEPVTFGVGTHYIVMRKRNGFASGLLVVTAGVDAYHVVLAVAIDPAEYAFEDGDEPPLYAFGLPTSYAVLGKIANLNPNDDDSVEVTAVPYRAELYTGDGTPGGSTGTGNLQNAADRPEVTGLIVIASPYVANEVIASWNAVRGATYYVVELSYDGVTWEQVSSFVEDTHKRFTVVPRLDLYVRVAAVRTGQGDWTYWRGTAPVDAALNTYTAYIFRRLATAPDTPIGADPADWFDAPPAGTEPLWMSLATFNAITDAILTTWSDPVNLKGDDGVLGEDGDSVFVEYSIDGLAGWHDVFVEGDIFMRQKIGLAGAWSDAIRVVGEQGAAGEDGDDGNDGNYFEYRFKRSATQPPAPIEANPDTWFDAPPAADGNPVWMTRALKNAAGGLLGVWSTPAQMEGNSIFVEYSVNGLSEWHPAFLTGDIYMRQKIGVSGTWSDAIKIVGEDGASGPGAFLTLTVNWHPSGGGGGWINGARQSGFSTVITGLNPGRRLTVEADATVLTAFSQWGGGDTVQLDLAPNVNQNIVTMGGNVTLLADYY